MAKDSHSPVARATRASHSPASLSLASRFSAWLLILGMLIASPDAVAAQDSAIQSARNSITAAETREIVDFLASDTLEGRAIGTRGGRAAANYIVKMLTDLKVAPGGEEKTWFQSFQGNARNILGVVRGSDPELSKEYILVGAHYDHVGYGNDRNSNGPVGYIHNGADDNASGVAALLEVVEAVQSLPVPPKRSIIFAFWDGEEDGLLGSIHWCNNPTVPLASLKLAFNMDMVGRLRNRKLEVYGSRTAVGLRQLVSGWNVDSLNLDFTWEMKADSDHHSFYAKRIPVM
ncbi:MAG TPA: M20/M25/M40 family metallo-hydrolase, partial [Pirellulales bacterium]